MLVVAHNGARVWGGAERATALLLAGLAERGHQVLLLCNTTRVAEEAQKLGVPAEIQPLRGDLVLVDALRLAARLRALRPDAFIIGTFRKLWLAALASRLARVRHVVARIGLETDGPRRWKYRFSLRHWVHTAVVNSRRMRPAFLETPGWTESRVQVIYNGIRPHPEPIDPGALRRSLRIPDDAPVIGAVARLVRQKRIDRLLEVVQRLPKEVHCVIAGTGGRRDALHRLAAELELTKRVHFLGHRSDVGEVLGALDLLVITSDHEGLSNSMLEALAMGVPVVSTPVSGADEALEPLADGRLPGVVTSWEPGEIAVEIKGILADRTRLASMREAARRRARERFSWEGYLDQWERLLTGRATPRPVEVRS